MLVLETTTPLGLEAPLMKLWFTPVPSKEARPIVVPPEPPAKLVQYRYVPAATTFHGLDISVMKLSFTF